MNEYFSLLLNGDIKGAEIIRKQSIPSTLIKFFSLNDNEKLNDMKIQTLRNEKLWFSSISDLNDPYEYKCMFIDDEKLRDLHYPDKIIQSFHKMFCDDSKNFGLVSLSGNTFNSLPMWAYYTNNYEGFCVEYEVTAPDAIFAVGYEPRRIPIGSLAAHFFKEYNRFREEGKQTSDEAEFYVYLLKHQFYLKHESWKHEKEYRIIHPLPSPDAPGCSVPIASIGLKTKRIVLGLNCKEQYVEALSQISKQLGCTDVARLKISDTEFTFLEGV